MMLLSVLPITLLVIVLAWFVWPLIADPIARRFAAKNASSASADDFFDTRQKHGLGSPVSPQARRG